MGFSPLQFFMMHPGFWDVVNNDEFVKHSESMAL